MDNEPKFEDGATVWYINGLQEISKGEFLYSDSKLSALYGKPVCKILVGSSTLYTVDVTEDSLYSSEEEALGALEEHIKKVSEE